MFHRHIHLWKYFTIKIFPIYRYGNIEYHSPTHPTPTSNLNMINKEFKIGPLNRQHKFLYSYYPIVCVGVSLYLTVHFNVLEQIFQVNQIQTLHSAETMRKLRFMIIKKSIILGCITQSCSLLSAGGKALALLCQHHHH